MDKHQYKIDPAKVTKPIQLLAAWLIGLIITNVTFLTAAAKIQHPWWLPALLVISAIFNVPLFLFALFILQTKFRPELQEDEYYSKYIESRESAQTGKPEVIKTIKSGTTTEKIEFVTNSRRPHLGKSSKISVEINDMLSNFREIVSDLKFNKIKIGKTFGSTSLGEVPAKFIVAIGPDVPISVIASVIKITSKYRLDGISMAGVFGDEIEYKMSQGRIYIGSYNIGREDRYLKLNDGDLQKLCDDNNIEYLEQILKNVPGV